VSAEEAGRMPGEGATGAGATAPPVPSEPVREPLRLGEPLTPAERASEQVSPDAALEPAMPGDGGVERAQRTVVHVVRHGEVHNPAGILYGRLPGFRLSDNGRDQADVVAKALADADVAAVVASPMQRAQETAAPIAAAHGLEIRTDGELIEASNLFEGLDVSIGDGVLRRPEHWWKLRDPFTPSWGEPYLQIAHRMLAAVHRARAAAPGHEVVCVSHQLPIWTLRRFLTGRRLWHDPRRRQCALASVTSLVFEGTRFVGVRYSEPAGGSNPMQTGA
jgi:broad specificity phosphatase PhoE